MYAVSDIKDKIDVTDLPSIGSAKLTILRYQYQSEHSGFSLMTAATVTAVLAQLIIFAIFQK